MNQPAKIILKQGKEKSLLRYHPWVFSGAVNNIIGRVKEGDIVEIYDSTENYIATGHYQPDSITARIFTFIKVNPDKKFWKTKFVYAFKLRKRLGLVDSPSTNVYRLINGEGDGFPGLIIDFYNGTAVFQAHSAGMYYHRDMFVEILKEVYGNKLLAVYDKSYESLPRKAGIDHQNSYIFGSQSEDYILENDLKYFIDIAGGQKTGFFVDQRENRLLLSKYAKDKTALNAFCYTGGFSASALKAGAALVHSVDSSKKAIEILNKNITLNNFETGKHQTFCEDVSNFFINRDSEGNLRNLYDIIILDPPAFGKHHDVLENALKGYRSLNKKAIEIIKPGGLLFTFSCSQIVTKENFRTVIFSASAMAHRNVKILHQISHSPDHPISIYHPEGEYLKGFVLLID